MSHFEYRKVNVDIPLSDLPLYVRDPLVRLLREYARDISKSQFTMKKHYPSLYNACSREFDQVEWSLYRIISILTKGYYYEFKVKSPAPKNFIPF